ncbi:hypothetical protein HNR46_000453 [Haloferula luteola]|uniref:Uncharacterized protein n=1 Tax=Haloferula luteola TaxID=595692 RepID=A0A840V8W9_9BACT|nr:hypothetical protein [Haloferula luteola]
MEKRKQWHRNTLSTDVDQREKFRHGGDMKSPREQPMKSNQNPCLQESPQILSPKSGGPYGIADLFAHLPMH